MENASFLKCIGCSSIYGTDTKSPVYTCQNRGDINVNHILEKHLKISAGKLEKIFSQKENNYNPYLKFHDFFFSKALANKYQIDLAKIINDINTSLRNISEPGFVETPIYIYDIEGPLYIKNETINVSGSHKARHLMGNMIYMEVLRAAGILRNKSELAIYSCGNAALGAAAVAKAAEYKLNVFIPPGVNKNVINKLRFYGANIVECPRCSGEKGDPCYNRFQEALLKGAVPFSCAGTDNWANIEGGQTLFLEYIYQCLKTGKMFDSIVIQIGGGALANSAVKTIEELYAFNIIKKLPKIYVVQTEGCYPLVRAYYLIIREIAQKNGLKCSLNYTKESSTEKAALNNKKLFEYSNGYTEEITSLASFIKENYNEDRIQTILKNASQRSMNSYMWAWETEPHSIAHGILDDITYDWFKIIEGLLKTAGQPVIVTETELQIANQKAKEITNINVDYTGSSGFTGYLKLRKRALIQKTETAAVIFTGVIR